MLKSALYLELNFNGESRGNQRIIDIGAIVHDKKGVIILNSTKPIWITTNNIEEIEVLVEGLRMCSSNDIQTLEIEGISLNIVNDVRRGKPLIGVLILD